MDVAAYARYHFSLRNGLDRDLYQESIAAQMEYLEKVIDDESTNFRNKLHRADWPKEQLI